MLWRNFNFRHKLKRKQIRSMVKLGRRFVIVRVGEFRLSRQLCDLLMGSHVFVIYLSCRSCFCSSNDLFRYPSCQDRTCTAVVTKSLVMEIASRRLRYRSQSVLFTSGGQLLLRVLAPVYSSYYHRIVITNLLLIVGSIPDEWD